MRALDSGRGSRLRRISYFVIPALLLLFNLPAAAADYIVAYALDGIENIETGGAECEYRSYCDIKFENAGVLLSLGFRDARHTSLGIRAYAPRRANCCFFSDGVDSVSRDIRVSSLIRLHVYEGHRRRGNEFKQNLPIGVVYLKISDLQR